MHDQPSVQEILEAVQAFLTETAANELKGHSAFSARVAANLLSIALRDHQNRSTAEISETAGLISLLNDENPSPDLEHMRRRLCARIMAGDLDLNSPGLFGHLKTTAIQQLKVDQPKYSGLRKAEE